MYQAEEAEAPAEQEGLFLAELPSGARATHRHPQGPQLQEPHPRLPLTPEVMMTDWNLSKTGLMAMEASMQLEGQDECLRGQAANSSPQASLLTPHQSPWPFHASSPAHSPEMQDGVGDGGGPVVKGLYDDGEACRGVRALESASCRDLPSCLAPTTTEMQPPPGWQGAAPYQHHPQRLQRNGSTSHPSLCQDWVPPRPQSPAPCCSVGVSIHTHWPVDCMHPHIHSLHPTVRSFVPNTPCEGSGNY